MAGLPAIWRLALDDCSTAAELLSRAFQDDSFFTTCIPDPELRRVHLPPFFAACLRYGVMYGRVYAAGQDTGRMEGVAWWYRFPEAHYDLERTRAAGFDDVDRLLGAGSEFIETISGRVDAEMESILPQPRANLDQIGIDPASQRTGIGSALVQHIVRDAAREGLPVALWTDALTSVAFYERQGFHVAVSGGPPENAIDWWAMLRPLA